MFYWLRAKQKNEYTSTTCCLKLIAALKLSKIVLKVAALELLSSNLLEAKFTVTRVKWPLLEKSDLEHLPILWNKEQRKEIDSIKVYITRNNKTLGKIIVDITKHFQIIDSTCFVKTNINSWKHSLNRINFVRKVMQ